MRQAERFRVGSVTGDSPGPDEEAAVADLARRVFTAARTGDTATLEHFLRAGLPVNLCNESGDSMLMLAAYHGHAETVTALLRGGADPNRRNDRGQAPLAGAVFKSEDEVVEALLVGGADPDAGAPTARETARMFGRADLLGRFS